MICARPETKLAARISLREPTSSTSVKPSLARAQVLHLEPSMLLCISHEQPTEAQFKSRRLKPMQLPGLTESLPQLNLVDERTNVHNPPGEAWLLYAWQALG